MVLSSHVSRIKRNPVFFFHSFSCFSLQYPNSTPLLRRTIFSTAQTENWFEKVKGFFTGSKSESEVQLAPPTTNLNNKSAVSTGNKTEPESKPIPETSPMEKMEGVFTGNLSEAVCKSTPQTSTFSDRQAVTTGIKTVPMSKPTTETPTLEMIERNKTEPEGKPTPQASTMEKMEEDFKEKVALPKPQFRLSTFADFIKYAKMAENLKSFLPGQTLNSNQAADLEKQEKIFRYLAGFDDTGENLQSKQKLDAARHCSCTLAEVESALLKFSLCKKAEGKLKKMKKEGKPLPTSIAEIENLFGVKASSYSGPNDLPARMIYKDDI